MLSFRQPAVINKRPARSSAQKNIKEERLQSYRVLVQGTHGKHSIRKPSPLLLPWANGYGLDLQGRLFMALNPAYLWIDLYL